MTTGTQRASSVSPQDEHTSWKLFPVEEEPDARQIEDDDVGAPKEEASEGDEIDSWKEQVEDLARRVAQHFENEHEKEAVGPPVIKAPVQPTQKLTNLGAHIVSLREQ